MKGERVLLIGAMVLTVFLFLSADVFAGKRAENKQWLLSVGPLLEYVRWKEDVPGEKDVRVDGFRYGLSAGLTVYPRQSRDNSWFNYWTARFSGQIFFSRSLEYNRVHTDETSVESDVRHSGWNFSALFGYGRKEMRRVILPFWAFEWNKWNAVLEGRNLEDWDVGIIKFGLIYTLCFGNGAVEITGSIGTGFHEKKKVRFSRAARGANDVTLEPDLRYQLELSATYYFGFLFAKGYWTYRSFDESAKETLTIPTIGGSLIVPVNQPETSVNIFGVTIGVYW